MTVLVIIFIAGVLILVWGDELEQSQKERDISRRIDNLCERLKDVRNEK